MKNITIILSVFRKSHIFATVCGAVFMLACNLSHAAEVVSRATSSAVQSRPTTRANNAITRMPTLMTTIAPVSVSAPPTETATEPVTEPEEEQPVIEDKSSQFTTALGGVDASGTDTAADSRADLIRAQRAALDASTTSAAAAQSIETALSRNKNACDTGLRDCMRKDCGNDFSKCAGDGDTIWGDKLDRCRRNLKCSGEEFQTFAREIKTDRDFNSKMASYNDVLNCGNRYNSCVITQCGTDLKKCLGKSAGDKAIADCSAVARDCQTIDNGLANRTMQVFGTLRQGAEVQAKKDEERLYELRRLMSDACGRLGAMFDERSLDCVFTVNFFAGDTNTLFASKKAYAGDTFDCTQNWFGVDITTYRENAYRLTREQTAASSSFMGSGLGVAAGAISSGAINRAMDRATAERALKKAEAEHDAAYNNGTNNATSSQSNQDTDSQDNQGATGLQENQDSQDESDSTNNDSVAKLLLDARGIYENECEGIANNACTELAVLIKEAQRT